jgi:cell division protein FtsL
MSPRHSTAADPHRQGLRREPAPRAPRRVSGPARPPAHARVSESVAYRDGAVALPRVPAPRVGVPRLARRVVRRLGELPEHRWLDRLLTGRAWIGVVAIALIGIVFTQVSLLKLNAGIGRAVEKISTLDRENAVLRADVSRLGSNDRIQTEAEALGMVLPAPGSVRFLGKDGKAVGGDAVTSLAVGTPTGAAPADSTYGATAATPGSTTSATTSAPVTSATTTTSTSDPSAPASTVAAASPSQSPASSPQASAPATSTTGASTVSTPVSSQVAPVAGGTTAP